MSVQVPEQSAQAAHALEHDLAPSSAELNDAQAARRSRGEIADVLGRIEQIDSWASRATTARQGASWAEWWRLATETKIARCGGDKRLVIGMNRVALDDLDNPGSSDRRRAKYRQELVDSITLTDDEKAAKRAEYQAWLQKQIELSDQDLLERDREEFVTQVRQSGFDPEKVQTREAYQEALDRRSERRSLAYALGLDDEVDWAEAQLQAEIDRREAEATFRQKVKDSMEQIHEAPVALYTELKRAKVKELANEYLAAQRGSSIEMPELMTLTELQAKPDPEHRYAIDHLWPDGGKVLFAAQRKAGKTTVVGNLVRSLVDGDLFLDEFAPAGRKRVALLDFELSESMLQRWLTDQEIDNTDNLTVVPMSGRARSFNILDDNTRSRWVKLLEGHDVLIIDPLRPILHALGLNEWSETGPLLQAFDELRREAGIAEGMIVQHHGHHSERAAGDSNLVGWADANWNITRDDPNDPRSFRFFDAYGRDVDVQKGLVSMYDGRRLAFAADASAAKEDVVTERIIDGAHRNSPELLIGIPQVAWSG